MVVVLTLSKLAVLKFSITNQVQYYDYYYLYGALTTTSPKIADGFIEIEKKGSSAIFPASDYKLEGGGVKVTQV